MRAALIDVLCDVARRVVRVVVVGDDGFLLRVFQERQSIQVVIAVRGRHSVCQS